MANCTMQATSVSKQRLGKERVTAKAIRWWRLAGVVSLTTGLLGVAGAPAAHASVPISKVGWWTRSPSPAGPPAGGIEVGSAPDGNLSVAAIELDTGGGASGATLTLVESGGQAQQAASLQACPTSDQWNQANGDNLNLAPRAQCPATPYSLTRDSSGNWTIDLTPLLAGRTGPVGVMIVPGPAPAPSPTPLPGGAQPGAFQVAFAPPTVAGTVAPGSDTSSSGSTSGGSDQSPSVVTTFPAPSSTPDFSVANSPAFSSVGVTPSAVLPPAAAAPAPAVAPAAAPTATPSAAGGGQAIFPTRPTGSHKKGTSFLVVLAWLLLSGIVGAAAGGWRWAKSSGRLERLIPKGRRGSLLPPIA